MKTKGYTGVREREYHVCLYHVHEITFFFNSRNIPLIFRNQLRFELSIAVSWYIYLEFTVLTLLVLCGMTISFIVCLHISLMIFFVTEGCN